MVSLFESLTEGLTIKNNRIRYHEDWLIFKRRLDDLVSEGKARQVQPPKGVDGRGYEWYLDIATGDVYCYGAPNPPTLPEWKRFDLESEKKGPQANFVQDLGNIPKGNMRLREAQNLKVILGFMVRDGRVEQLTPRDWSLSVGTTETRYRDLRTGMVYRLMEIDSEKCGRWEQVSAGETGDTVQ